MEIEKLLPYQMLVFSCAAKSINLLNIMNVKRNLRHQLEAIVNEQGITKFIVRIELHQVISWMQNCSSPIKSVPSCIRESKQAEEKEEKKVRCLDQKTDLQ